MDPSAPKLLELLMKLRREGIHDSARFIGHGTGAAQPIYPPILSPFGLCRSNAAHWLWSDHQPTPDRGPDDPIPPARTDQPCLRNWHRFWYQAAVLAHLCRRVATIERHGPLYESARAQFAALELYNIDTRLGDGFAGWPETAPFDAIIVTCAPEEVPDTLFAQLAIGGRLVAPVGQQGARQDLKVFTRKDANRLTVKRLGTAEFVPMVSDSKQHPVPNG